MSTEMVRVNTRISSSLNDYLDKISREDGIPKSTLVMLAIEQYRQQREAVQTMQFTQQSLKQLYDKVEAIEQKIDKQ